MSHSARLFVDELDRRDHDAPAFLERGIDRSAGKSRLDHDRRQLYDLAAFAAEGLEQAPHGERSFDGTPAPRVLCNELAANRSNAALERCIRERVGLQLEQQSLARVAVDHRLRSELVRRTKPRQPPAELREHAAGATARERRVERAFDIEPVADALRVDLEYRVVYANRKRSLREAFAELANGASRRFAVQTGERGAAEPHAAHDSRARAAAVATEDQQQSDERHRRPKR